MAFQEIKIAQAEHALYEAGFKQQNEEGMRVYTPNIIDRASTALKTLLEGLSNHKRSEKTQRQGARYAQSGAPAK
jgi:hypothetical protein